MGRGRDLLTKVVPFTGITKLDLAPDRVIDGLADIEFEGLVVLGYRADGTEYFASTYADGGDVVWLLERCKLRLLTVVSDC